MTHRWRFNFKAVSVVVLLAVLSAGCTLPVCTGTRITVTRADDVAGGGLCRPENCSLRQAIVASNACSGVQTVSIPAGRYLLTLAGAGEDAAATGDLDITDSVRIVGNDMPVIDGNASDRIFDIRPGATVEMSGIVIQNGYGGDGFGPVEGGGITNAGNLTASGLLIWNNAGRPLGTYAAGGLANTDTGRASISHSAILMNSSGEGAGGVANYGTMTLDNVTVSGNGGYGIFHTGPSLEISYSTFAGNAFWTPGSNSFSQAQIAGSNPSIPVVIRNSIVNGYPETAGCRGTVSSQGFNIEYSATDLYPLDHCNFTGPGDLVDVDPQLLPLGVHAGATIAFHALDPASPAIDSADPADCSGTDQRGVARPQGSACDRGSYEREISSTPIGLTLIPFPFPFTPITLTPPPLPIPSVPITPEIPFDPFILVVQVPANCRLGPGTAYPVVNSALPGEQVEVLGKNAESTWWYSQVDNDKCWISDVAGKPSGDLDLLTVIEAPPTPVPTATEKPGQEQPTQPTGLDFDQDGYDAQVDCNDKDASINPGAAETPDDKVDSNCNGDDDQ
jgi:hypothetical protein